MISRIKSRTVLLGVTAGIAAYKSCDVISGLRKMGINVEVIMTEHSCKFITPLTLQAISGNKVYTDMFDVCSWQPEHVELAGKADLILIAPATADIIAKLAAGIADELLTSVVLATDRCVMVAPAMNEAMYKNIVTQDNIKKLKARNFIFIPPEKGRLASGAIGTGRLAATATILKKVEELLSKNIRK